MKRLIFLLAFLLSGCLAQPAPAPTSTPAAPFTITAEENPRAPQPGDDQLNREYVILTSINLIERIDLDPARVQITFSGSMPGVCNELRLQVAPPDKEYRIAIDAYSMADPKIKCENVFQQFETTILLGVYSPGRYAVWVNAEYVGDFVTY